MLRTLWIPLSMVVLIVASTGQAQERADLRRDAAPRVVSAQDTAPGVVSPTVEMWFYEQERLRHDDPKMVIRQRAELRAQQRQDRLAAQQWYGLSNSRPSVSPTPWFGSYSAFWGSNGFDPQRWRPTVAPLVVMRPRDAY